MGFFSPLFSAYHMAIAAWRKRPVLGVALLTSVAIAVLVAFVLRSAPAPSRTR
jgi:uncharacterized membrane protein